MSSLKKCSSELCTNPLPIIAQIMATSKKSKHFCSSECCDCWITDLTRQLPDIPTRKKSKITKTKNNKK